MESTTKRIVVPSAEELIGQYFPVLDHGFISLVEYMGGDKLTERAARNSYKYGTKVKTDTRGLLRSLMRRGHSTPFEMCEVVLHCAMPIFVARQWIRIRTASTNEMSARYSVMPMAFYTPNVDRIKAQSKVDKQGSGGKLTERKVQIWLEGLETSRYWVSENYRWATESDFARELARIDLPVSTYTSWFWKIDSNNLFKHLSLRCDEHAQWETQQYFIKIAGIAKRLMPHSFDAWFDYHFMGARFSRMDLLALHEWIETHSLEVTENKMKSLGMKKQERAEFWQKLSRPFMEYPDFNLYLDEAKPGSYFEAKFEGMHS